MGLPLSTSLVPTTEPTIFMRSEACALMPVTRPISVAKREVSVAVSSTPLFCTNACSLARPSQARPGRMSSVESFFPTRFGVSGVFFHGSGFPQPMGMPLMMAVGPEKKKADRRKENDVVLGVQVIDLRDFLRADVVVGNFQIV